MKPQLALLFCFVLCLSLLGHSQVESLKRRASLGIHLEEMTDSLAKAHNVGQLQGVYIPHVFPEATADELGIEAGDVLIEVNEKEVNSIQEVLSMISNLREDDRISLRYIRDGKTKTVKGKAIGRPKETSEYADVHYEQVVYEGNQLRSILHLPKGKENPPVVFYIQGYMCQSVELAAVPDITIRRLIDDWVKAGYAVYRVEKPGMGDSDCEKGCYDLDFNEETEAFRQAYLTLQKDSRIDSSNIFLFGHSIGGLIAPVLAPELSPKGVITYGTAVNSWFEYMQELTRVQGEMFNLPYAEIERDIRNSTPFWYALFVDQQSNEEILQNKTFYEMLEREGILEDFKNGQFMDRHYTYWSTIHHIEFVNEWSKVKSHVLALHGEYDIQALNANHIYTIERAVNSANPDHATALVIPKADHGFVEFNSMEENIQTLNAGLYRKFLMENYNSEVAKTTIEWMDGIVK